MDRLTQAVAARYARSQRMDLAWVEKLRKDFLTLTKNLPRVKDYKTALQLNDAFRTFRENFKNLVFDNFINRDLKYNLGLAEGDSKWFGKKLSTSAWNFQIELSVPIDHANDYYSEEARYRQFEEAAPKWKARVQRRATEFWKDIKEFIEYYERNFQKPVDIKMPTVENTTLEGFKLEMRGYEEDDEDNRESLSILKEGLRIYRARASAVAPILLQKQVPITCEFKSTLDQGGEYGNGHITFYMSSANSLGPKWVAHALAHEMGHHLFKTVLTSEAREFWHQTIRGDFGDIDVDEILAKWPGNAWAFDIVEKHGHEDPLFALQVDALSHDHSYGELQTKEDFEKLRDKGFKTLRVPQHPVTGYGNKNPEEAFCEAIGLLVAYGPRAVHERVQWWLNTVLPGKFKVATIVERVAARSR